MTIVPMEEISLGSGMLISNEPLSIQRDRKSTRLNSSHDQISYAVFCLKKKKWQQNNQIAFSMVSDKPTLLVTLPSTTFPTNTWMFFAIVYDNTNFYIYSPTSGAKPALIGNSV